MFTRFLAAGLIVSAMFFSLPMPSRGQGTASDQDKNIQKTKVKIQKLGTGERARVTIKLKNETIYRGYIRTADDDGFVVMDKTSSPHDVKYAEVKSVSGGGGLSGGAKLGLGIAIGAGVVLTILALIVHSDD